MVKCDLPGHLETVEVPQVEGRGRPGDGGVGEGGQYSTVQHSTAQYSTVPGHGGGGEGRQLGDVPVLQSDVGGGLLAARAAVLVLTPDM